MKISFLGAAGEVTGSCYLVETSQTRFMVDCGMFQGGREAGAKNLAALGFDLKSVDFILITHAHLDHTGLLPRASLLGYRGPIYATHATVDLLEVMLLDSAHIQEKEAEWQLRHSKKRSQRRGFPRTLLYTVAQAQSTLRQMRGVAYETPFHPNPSVRVLAHDAGHILGSAILEVDVEDGGRTHKLVFSGDLGQPYRPLMHDPKSVSRADILLVESTYGNRLHKNSESTEDELVELLKDTLHRRGGNVIVPAFAVGRTQEVLYVLVDLVRRNRMPELDIHVDSPMAMKATELTLKHEELLDRESRELIAWQRANAKRARVNFVEDVEESMALNRVRQGAVIISASGMCDAGRIKHHLLHNISRRECAVLITGFQAAGTLGRRLVDGAKRVTLFGNSVPVRAGIHTLGGLSAHADQAALLGWLKHIEAPPTQTFVVHGELETARGFAQTITERLGWQHVSVPAQGDSVVI